MGDLAWKNKGDFDLLFLWEPWRLLDEFLLVVFILELKRRQEDFVLKYYLLLLDRFDFSLSQISWRI